MLDFIEGAFGEKALLTKIEYRRALTQKVEMPTRSDGTNDLLVFLYLNGVSEETGSTSVIPGIHKVGTAENDGYLQMPQDALNRVKDRGYVPVKGGPEPA